jgi:CheY-like chemotaxis protein
METPERWATIGRIAILPGLAALFLRRRVVIQCPARFSSRQRIFPVEPRTVVAVIDDEPAVIALVETVLEDEGYETIAWPTGAGAHAFIRERMPAVILLDVRMETPEAGLDVLRALRRDEATRAIPVLLTTSRMHFGPAQAVELDALGATRLPKPFSPTALLDAITAVTATQRRTGTG